MKPRTLQLISILFIILLFCSQGFSQAKPKAIQGVIDLTHWDFNRDGIVKLDGNWEFYWNKFYFSADFKQPDSLRKFDTINVPNFWNKKLINKQVIGGEGFATYRLKILIKKYDDQLALKLLTFSTAYDLYVNGKKIAVNGKLGKNRASMTPSYKPLMVSFPVENQEIEIIFHISKFYHQLGGPWQVIELGRESDIISKTHSLLSIELFLIGSILIMSLYHFGLYVIRRKEKSPLFFGIFCLVITVRVAFTGEYSINLLHDFSWETLVFFEYLSFYTAAPAISFFIYSLFPNEFYKKFLYFSVISYLIFSGIVVATPVSFYSKTVIGYEAVGLITGLYILKVLIHSIIRKREGAKVFVTGFVVLLATFINDTLYQNDIIHTMNLISEGLFVFIFSQAFLLSSRFSKAFLRTEELTTQLDSINKNLEGLVNVRTAEIMQQKEELQTQAESLEEANAEITIQKNEIEKSHSKLTASINYAKLIQTAVLPSTDMLSMLLPEHFVLYKPRDIVSGDFYFIKQIKNLTVFAVADCTGHGVRGAFMSMLGIGLLNEIVHQSNITHCSQVLDRLRDKIKASLNQEGILSQTDGMDIAICAINLEDMRMQYAGAHNSLIIFRKKQENSPTTKKPEYEMLKLQADCMPVGVYPKERPFTNHEIELQPNDMLYIFSDGYYSQLGGDKKQTYKSLHFRELLKQIHTYPLDEQKEFLEKKFTEWKGGMAQTDDVLVMGVKIKN